MFGGDVVVVSCASQTWELSTSDFHSVFPSFGVNMKEITAAAVNALTVAQIKAELSTKGLSTKGKKDDLAARLLEAEGLGSMTLPGEASSSKTCNTQNDDEAVDIIVAQMEKEAAKDSNQGAPSYKSNHEYSELTSKSDGHVETLPKTSWPPILSVSPKWINNCAPCVQPWNCWQNLLKVPTSFWTRTGHIPKGYCKEIRILS